MKFFFSLLFLLTIQVSLNAQYPIITTIAGTGTNDICNMTGINGPALLANLTRPWDIVVDDVGNIYFTEQLCHVVCKINNNGILSVYAGTADVEGFNGDGGPANQAKFRFPFYLEIDNNNNLYVADWLNSRVRKVDNTTNIITTFAGGYIGNCATALCDNAPPANIRFYGPYQMAWDETNNSLYIVDEVANLVRKVNLTTNIAATIIGNGSMTNTGDGGLAINANVYASGVMPIETDANGNIYMGTQNLIRKIDINTGIVNTIAGESNTWCNAYLQHGLPFDSIMFGEMRDFTIDSAGNMYIAEVNHLHRIDAETQWVTTLCGENEGFAGDGGPFFNAKISARGIYVKHGKMYISDGGNSRIRIFDLPIPLRLNFTQQNVSCYTQSLGSITVEGIYGLPPYWYSLDNGPYQTSNTFTGLPEGTYTIHVRDTIDDHYWMDITIGNDTQLPTANFTHTQIDNFNLNFTNTSSAADSVLWIFPGNVTDTTINPSFNFAAEGNYNVMLIAYNGCGADTTTINVQVDKLSGIAENSIATFNLYPNPADDNLVMQLQAAQPVKGKLQIINTLGQVVYGEAVNFNATYTKTIDISTFAGGLYMVTLQTGQGNIGRKLVVE